MRSVASFDATPPVDVCVASHSPDPTTPWSWGALFLRDSTGVLKVFCYLDGSITLREVGGPGSFKLTHCESESAVGLYQITRGSEEATVPLSGVMALPGTKLYFAVRPSLPAHPAFLTRRQSCARDGFRMGDLIGEGLHGRVSLVKHLMKGFDDDFAIKILGEHNDCHEIDVLEKVWRIPEISVRLTIGVYVNRSALLQNNIVKVTYASRHFRCKPFGTVPMSHAQSQDRYYHVRLPHELTRCTPSAVVRGRLS